LICKQFSNLYGKFGYAALKIFEEKVKAIKRENKTKLKALVVSEKR